jgi:hypothetical protein
VVVPHLRPDIAQLAFLQVSQVFRLLSIGRRLCDELHQIARDAGDTEVVVSATPSENTVRFYMNRGYELMASPLPELYDREPEDVHLRKVLSVSPPPSRRRRLQRTAPVVDAADLLGRRLGRERHRQAQHGS